MNSVEIIAKRRDGVAHTAEELEFLALGAARSTVPDYQLAAWLMAAYLNPLSLQETAHLTLAMANSGTRLNLSDLPKPTLDKHSTGGVGDKTTMVLLPLLASCGVTMVKMSGRGLGITGGTVDKLASIPGFRVDLSPDELLRQAAEIGVAITGQTPDLAPADKALYTLRDVTATVNSIPLIVSSILSKKLAGGAETVLIDVKCGSGGFMPTLGDARRLAAALKDASSRVGLNLRLAITDMDQPLGRAAGNAMEVKEAMRVLRGEEAGRFRDLCLDLAVLALVGTGKIETAEKAREVAVQALEEHLAHEKARQWVIAQGGDPSVLDHEDWLPAKARLEVTHQGPSGFVEHIDARAVGLAVVELGGGRKKKDDAIDPTVGIETLKEIGDPLREGEPVFRVHAGSNSAAEGVASALIQAIVVTSKPVEKRSAILEVP